MKWISDMTLPTVVQLLISSATLIVVIVVGMRHGLVQGAVASLVMSIILSTAIVITSVSLTIIGHHVYKLLHK